MLVTFGPNGIHGMAKKKPAVKATEPAQGRVERLSVINLKGSPEYRDWLNGLSEKSLISTSVIVRDALAMWAEKRGYEAPPKL